MDVFDKNDFSEHFGDHQELTLSFIKDYRSLPILWRPDLKGSVNKYLRIQAAKVLCEKYSLSLGAMKNKIRSLRSYFRRENRRCTEETNYTSTWFAYKHMLFLLDYDTSKTDKSSNQDQDFAPNKINFAKKDAEPQKFAAALNDDRTFSNSVETSERHKHIKKKKKRSFQEFKRNHTVPEYNNTKSDDTSDFIKALKALNEGTPQHRDEYTIFGEHVACQIRSLNNPRIQAMAKHRIATVLYEIELKNIDEQNGVESGQTE